MVLEDASRARRVELELLDAIAARGQTKFFPPRTIIIHEGDPGDAVYLINSGKGKIYSTNESGREIIFDNYGPGDILGEPILDGGVRSASVMTLEATSCSMIRASDFKEMISQNPGFALHVISKLIRLLRASNQNVKSLALEDVYGRVVRFLMQRATQVGEEWVIEERLTQQGIADRVGSSREMVSRIFKDLEKGNYISVDRNRIVIHRKPPAGW
ncbi:MAG: Crp/Fnr family transcriptional regulator [Burkholderiaceae bacterium]